MTEYEFILFFGRCKARCPRNGRCDRRKDHFGPHYHHSGYGKSYEAGPGFYKVEQHEWW